MTRPGRPDAALAAGLVARQLPALAHLPVVPIVPGGHDHVSFRLGDDLVLRLPSDADHALQVAVEHVWLARLAPRLPLPIPEAVALGAPDDGFPHEWAVRRWMDGDALDDDASGLDQRALGSGLAAFLAALQAVPAAGGPPPGPRNFERGAPFTVVVDEAVAALDRLGGEAPAAPLRALLDRAASTRWTGEPVWLHGDVAAGNLLARHGRLGAVIDLGGMAVGDPACDLTVAWTLLDDAGRAAFRAGLPVDDATWARAAGWAAWKALITLRDAPAQSLAASAARPRRDLLRLLADPLVA